MAYIDSPPLTYTDSLTYIDSSAYADVAHQNQNLSQNLSQNISSSPGDKKEHKKTIPHDLAFTTIEDGENIWSWNSEIIKRYHKSSRTWSYFWATLDYAQLEVRWDKQLRTSLYFLDGNQISGQRAKALIGEGSGLPVNTKIRAGEPEFTLHVNHDLPDLWPKGKKDQTGINTLKAGRDKLNNRYNQKYHPEYWSFTALGVSNDFVWVAVRSIPRSPKSGFKFSLPGGKVSSRVFRESSDLPIQGGIVRIDKNTGEYIRFTEKNGLPNELICLPPLSHKYARLPHFLSLPRFSQEVVSITPLKDGTILFTTFSDQQAWYDPTQNAWRKKQRE